MNRVIVLLLLMLSAVGAASAADKLTGQDVNLKAADGTTIKATYFAAAIPGPGILLLHQCNGQRKQWDPLVEKLVGGGFHVMTMDYRGFGESGGPKFNSISQQERAQIQAEKWPGDIDLAYKYLVSQPGVDRTTIGAGGASCGVNQAVQLARRHPQVKSLALLSGTTDRAGRQFLRSSPRLPIYGSAADDDDGAAKLIEWILVSGKNPANYFQHYKTGGHGYEMFGPHPELIGMLVQWYNTTLHNSAGQLPAGNVKASETAHVLELIDTPGGPQKVSAMIADARKRDAKNALFDEDLVNLIGYDYMQGGDAKGAIEVLKLNVEAFPESANAYDSVADAYFADGQKSLAKTNAEKAMALLEKDKSMPEARKKLIKKSAEKKLK